MTPEQIDALRAVPLGAMPNKLKIAFALERKTQSDICESAGITDSRMSLLVNGKYKTVTVGEASRIAKCFGCQIEDIFPLSEQAQVA
jgi:DNA-binding Xre family transcriptional regulator